MSAMLDQTSSKYLGTADGIPFWTFFGAEPEGGEGEGGSSGEGGNAGEGSSGEGEGGNEPPEHQNNGGKDPNAEAKARRLENKRLQKELDDAKAALEEKDRKEKSDLENAQRDLQDREDKLSRRDQVLQKNLLETAILKNDNWTWNDLDLVIASLSMDEITVDLDTGKVEGIEDELKRVAKEREFLVKASKKTKKEQQGGEGKPPATNGPSGYNPGQGGAGTNADKVAADRAALIRKHPGLRNRAR